MTASPPSAWPAAGQSILVRKLRPDGSEVFRWEGEILRVDDEGIVLRAPFNLPLVDLGFTTFRQGDVFVEFYYWDRWYNVYEILTPEGERKGWYANVGQPATLDRAQHELRYVDLEIDVWADGDGTDFRVLDEDEFQAGVAAGHYTPALQAGAERGQADLVDLARSGQLPRWAPDDPA